MPRSWFKTSIATIGKSIWLSLREPNIRILIAMNTYDNAAKRVHTIKRHWESNELLKAAFPELVADYRRTRWSDSCAEIKRTKRFDEGTYEAIGSGGAVISRHYDHIIEDDLVYAKKDDLSGGEIQPMKEDIEKAIGWHKLVYSLFTDPGRSTLDNIGTKWAVHDLKAYIRKNENHFQRLMITAEKLNSKGEPMGTDEPVWPERFGKTVLENIKSSQGPYMYATQYLNLPRDPADIVFQGQWLRPYQYDTEVPEGSKSATIVDLAHWGDTKGTCYNVIFTVSRDYNNHLWLRRYDRGKYNPTDVIKLIESHVKAYGSKAWVEEVQYQRALRHFAHRRMEETGFKYIIEPLKNDNRSGAKDLRIRSIEPEARNGFVHYKPTMKEFYNEFCDYPSGGTVDILDCLGYVTQRKLPRKPVKQIPREERSPFQLESIIEDIENRNRNTGYPFAIQNSPPKERKEYG